MTPIRFGMAEQNRVPVVSAVHIGRVVPAPRKPSVPAPPEDLVTGLTVIAGREYPVAVRVGAGHMRAQFYQEVRPAIVPLNQNGKSPGRAE